MTERPSGEILAASGHSDHVMEGGYADMAAEINAHWLHPSGHLAVRQNVWQWWHRRAQTGFPAGRLVPGRSKPHRVFVTADVLVWWLEYRERVRWRAQ